jgi:hypothetical protein
MRNGKYDHAELKLYKLYCPRSQTQSLTNCWVRSWQIMNTYAATRFGDMYRSIARFHTVSRSPQCIYSRFWKHNFVREHLPVYIPCEFTVVVTTNNVSYFYSVTVTKTNTCAYNFVYFGLSYNINCPCICAWQCFGSNLIHVKNDA